MMHSEYMQLIVIVYFNNYRMVQMFDSLMNLTNQSFIIKIFPINILQ